MAAILSDRGRGRLQGDQRLHRTDRDVHPVDITSPDHAVTFAVPIKPVPVSVADAWPLPLVFTSAGLD